MGGAPYTPYDKELSSKKEIWDVNQRGVNDWDLLNTERNASSHGLDLRVDKRWYFAKWVLRVSSITKNVDEMGLDLEECLDFHKFG